MHRARHMMHDETGAGGVLAVAIVAITIAVTVAVLSVGAALVVRQRAVAAADAAALAAADALLGVVPGDPCALAAEVASAHRVRLGTCLLRGAEAYIEVRGEVAGVPFVVRSRAGAPR